MSDTFGLNKINLPVEETVTVELSEFQSWLPIIKSCLFFFKVGKNPNLVISDNVQGGVDFLENHQASVFGFPITKMTCLE
jgi:hypothetical protein